MATNISHWLKVQSSGSKITYLQKAYFDQLLDYQILLLYIFHTFIIVAYFTLWMLAVFNTNQVSNSFDPKCRA